MRTNKSSRILFKGGTVVTIDARVPNFAAADVLIEGDLIVAVEAGGRQYVGAIEGEAHGRR